MTPPLDNEATPVADLAPSAETLASPKAPQSSPTVFITLKDVREWAAFGMSGLALLVSFGGYMNSKHSSDLSRVQFNSDRALVIVAEQLKEEKSSDAPLFTLRALNTAQRLSRVQLTVPSVFGSDVLVAYPPDQQISLWPIKGAVGRYFLKMVGRKPGYDKVLFPEIPVIFDATYTVGGVSMMRRGLYALRTEMAIGESDPPHVAFKDFTFLQEIHPNIDARKLLDDLIKSAKMQR